VHVWQQCFLAAAAVIVDVTAVAPLQDVYMESTEDENGVLINWSVSDKDLYDNFTVLYCVAADNAQHVCSVRVLLTSIVHWRLQNSIYVKF